MYALLSDGPTVWLWIRAPDVYAVESPSAGYRAYGLDCSVWLFLAHPATADMETVKRRITDVQHPAATAGSSRSTLHDARIDGTIAAKMVQ